MDLSKFRRKRYAVGEYVAGILAGDRVILAQAITLLESALAEDRALASEVLEACMPHTGGSFRLGITGSPGVGKSSFIEAFGRCLLGGGARLAVLAIDPSSQLSKGSILGDKTRMSYLATHRGAFIRPSPSGDSLGGVARYSREALLLCEAAGFDWVLVETVGVGQSETLVRSMTDFFLVLQLPNAGDELQGMKRGIMEMADWIFINKADILPEQARLAVRQCRNTLHLFPPKDSGWTAGASMGSALKQEGLEELIQVLLDYRQTLGQDLQRLRGQQQLYWFEERLRHNLEQWLSHTAWTGQDWANLKQDVQSGRQSPFVAADKFWQSLVQRLKP